MVKGKKGNLLKKKKGQNMVLEYGMDGTGKKVKSDKGIRAV
jgi:hypothetical protein